MLEEIMNLFDLQGKTALITGSSRGLGNAMARGLGEAGATIVLNGRNADRLAQAVDEFKADGIQAYGYAFDISDRDAVGQNIDAIEQEVGTIDILVNNAGINHRSPIEEFSTDDWHDIMKVNLTGPYFMAQEVGKRMIRRKAGKIINITSIAAEISRFKIAPYSASKGALKMLTKGLAVEWAQYNVQINAIGPGFYKTDMNEPLFTDPEFNKWVDGRVPAKRWGEPEELAGAVVFLASDASNYINGQTIYVDGGLISSY